MQASATQSTNITARTPTAVPFPPSTPPVVAFIRHLLQQALALVALHEAPGGPPYAGLCGSHLRHVIEHYEALVFPALPGVVDYDSRPRDAELETRAAVARLRLQALRERLLLCGEASLSTELRVRGLVGQAGESPFEVMSTQGRELAFVASHSVHHFALLWAYCAQHGLVPDADFGKAPSTVAHERAQLARAAVPGAPRSGSD